MEEREGVILPSYSTINHQWLIDRILMDKSVLKQFLKAGYVYDHKLFPTEAGTPQGGIISPILANMTLDGIENLLSDKYHKSKNGKARTQETLIDTLNPIITGWANYHQSVASSKIFHKLDSVIWNMLWYWAKRRHPTKPRKWVADKYWHTKGNRNWVFSTDKNQLKHLSDTKIVRHIPLKSDMNPYLDKDYFVLRKLKLRIKKLTGFAKEVWDKAKNVTKPEPETITNNCCPI